MKILEGTSYEKEIDKIKYERFSKKDILRNALYDKYVKYMQLKDNAVSNNMMEWAEKWSDDMKTTEELLTELNTEGMITLDEWESDGRITFDE